MRDWSNKINTAMFMDDYDYDILIKKFKQGNDLSNGIMQVLSYISKKIKIKLVFFLNSHCTIYCK